MTYIDKLLSDLTQLNSDQKEASERMRRIEREKEKEERLSERERVTEQFEDKAIEYFEDTFCSDNCNIEFN